MIAKEELLVSEYPSNFIPKGAVLFEAYDPASPSGDATCVGNGMYIDGVLHVQEVTYKQRTKVLITSEVVTND